MYFFTQIIRTLVALTFIFSGFVKLVDPLGSVYKLEEYFSADVLNLEFLVPYALLISLVLIFAELMFGVMLLMGYRVKETVWSLFFLTLIFLFLTWYSAYYNKVTDCGCFGDALQLSPWETFYKNVILIGLIIFLLFKSFDIPPVLDDYAGYFTLTAFVVFSIIAYYSLKHLPIIDFRPYAEEKNIMEGMLIPENAEKPVFEDIWIYNIDGENKSFSTDEKPWNIPGATYVDRKTNVISEGYVPPIHDFTMEKDGEDLTEQLLNEEKLMLIVMYNLSESKKRGLRKVAKLSEKALINGYHVYGFSASSEEDFQNIKEEYGFNFDMLFCDETTLKTIIRSNPGIVIINKGTITGKWSWRDTKKVKL
ncbi:MAG: BT_3928 family protein [Bacteroidota bacterium]